MTTKDQLEHEITSQITRFGVTDFNEVREIRDYLIRWSAGDLQAALEWAKNPTRRGSVWSW